MRVINHEIDTKNDIEIMPLADLHIGDAHVDYGAIAESINKIRNTENLYTILGGDLMNAATIGSPSDVYGERMTPSEQLKRCADIFQPLADQGKILGILPGNHELRLYKSVGTDITEIMAVQLGLGHLYSPTSALIFLRFGENTRGKDRKQVYSIFTYHGAGGGRRPGSKINRLQDMNQVVSDADIYLCGHTHLPAAFRDQVITTNHSNQTTTTRERLYINTCAYLDWSGSYGDRMGLPPQSKRPPIITLSAREHAASVIL